MVVQPMKRGVLLKLILTKKKGFVGDVKFRSSLGCRDCAVVAFRILKGRRRAKSKVTTLNFRRVAFGLFKDLLDKSPLG